MTGAKKDERARVQLEPTEPVAWPGLLVAVMPVYRYRFLFADGGLVDVLAVQDTSDLRGAVLAQRLADEGAEYSIIGVAETEQVGWTRAEPGPAPGALL